MKAFSDFKGFNIDSFKKDFNDAFFCDQLPSNETWCFTYTIKRWYPVANLTRIRSAKIFEQYQPGVYTFLLMIIVEASWNKRVDLLYHSKFITEVKVILQDGYLFVIFMRSNYRCKWNLFLKEPVYSYMLARYSTSTFYNLQNASKWY